MLQWLVCGPSLRATSRCLAPMSELSCSNKRLHAAAVGDAARCCCKNYRLFLLALCWCWCCEGLTSNAGADVTKHGRGGCRRSKTVRPAAFQKACLCDGACGVTGAGLEYKQDPAVAIGGIHEHESHGCCKNVPAASAPFNSQEPPPRAAARKTTQKSAGARHLTMSHHHHHQRHCRCCHHRPCFGCGCCCCCECCHP